jgi:ribosome-associated protein
MIEIIPGLQIDERELETHFVRASGPGGQNVNKVATAVQLRFDVMTSNSLPSEVKARLFKLAGSRLTVEGVLVIDARRYRTQEANRLDALQRFIDLVRKAAEQPKTRRRTKPSRASVEQRLKHKKLRSVIKRIRQTRVDE